jgi:hypothetical protein
MSVHEHQGRPRKNRFGEVHGPLTVLEPAEDVQTSGKYTRSTVNCLCVCGRVLVRRTDTLRFLRGKPATCRCGLKRGRPRSAKTSLILDALRAGKTAREVMDEFNVSHQYVSILRIRFSIPRETNHGSRTES